jgi:hypothetical protein
MTDQPQSPAQRLVGDTTPKLAQLTDDVLFGGVWAAVAKDVFGAKGKA